MGQWEKPLELITLSPFLASPIPFFRSSLSFQLSRQILLTSQFDLLDD